MGYLPSYGIEDEQYKSRRKDADERTGAFIGHRPVL